MIQRSSLPPSEEIEYPDSDGLPMSDNTLQFQWIVTIKEGLDHLFVGRDDVFVAGDLLWYPVKGHPEIRSAPDALVVFGRPKGYRGSYIQHREGGIAPQVVWEVLSPGNTAAELQNKFEFYQRYGVQEYYQYDPDHVRLRGWRRDGPVLVEILPIEGWTSPLTGVRMEIASGELVLTRPDGKRFLSYADLAQLQEETERGAVAARQEAERNARQAEEERQRAEEERRRAEEERQRAEQERLRAEQAARELEEERRRAEHAARQAQQEHERAERLAARLRELGIDPGA